MTVYWYLAGPMTGLPNYNFPRFREVAAKLREWGYNIVSPAELDPNEVVHETGFHPDREQGDREWRRYLRRDANIVMDENCLGVICLEGWEDSRGANVETFLAKAFKKPIYVYSDDGNATLTWIDRDVALEDHVTRIRQRIAEHPLSLDPYSPR